MRYIRPFLNAPVELTWVGSVPFATNLSVEKKYAKALNFQFNVTTFHIVQCLHKSVSGLVSSTLLPAGLGSISITTNIRSHLPSPGDDRLMLFTVATAYTEMLVAIPHIEFVKGILAALEQNSYFDVNKRNLILFDGQNTDASKDKRIVNLFTRGSHHRNLSVIYIVQNLFYQGKGSRSISLNSQYLVLYIQEPSSQISNFDSPSKCIPGKLISF